MDTTLPVLISYGPHHPDNGRVLLDIVMPGDDEETVFELGFSSSAEHGMILGVSAELEGSKVSLILVAAGASERGIIELEVGIGKRQKRLSTSCSPL